jgi:sugar lactone lactonase YvrE
MIADSALRCVADVHAILGEGPVWVAREDALYWLDIKGRKIFRLDEHDKLTEWPTPMRIGSIAPRRSGGFIAGTDEDRDRRPARTCSKSSPTRKSSTG